MRTEIWPDMTWPYRNMTRYDLKSSIHYYHLLNTHPIQALAWARLDRGREGPYGGFSVGLCTRTRPGTTLLLDWDRADTESIGSIWTILRSKSLRFRTEIWPNMNWNKWEQKYDLIWPDHTEIWPDITCNQTYITLICQIHILFWPWPGPDWSSGGEGPLGGFSVGLCTGTRAGTTIVLD